PDVGLIAIAANALRDPELGFKAQSSDTRFLYHALKKLTLPRDLEAYQEVQRAIDYFEDKEAPTPLPNSFNNPIDWELVDTIPADQRVRIITSQGTMITQLDVNAAPGSVANFVRLIHSGYYNEKSIHRVVPNFVVQDGCPRGDGWGAPDFSIRSEFAPLRYREGTLGMASAGPDTEGSQWFITHRPTPHLNGRYSAFGHLVQGQQVLHQLEVGDQILRMELVRQ
ncbi:MAG: peptidylprolyl isomerase, partial [Bacteroidota bacterium]